VFVPVVLIGPMRMAVDQDLMRMLMRIHPVRVHNDILVMRVQRVHMRVRDTFVAVHVVMPFGQHHPYTYRH
jgi:hypothetical protein